MPETKDVELAERLQKGKKLILDQLSRIIVGQEAVVEQLLVSLFARGHCLVVGVPGLAKTLLISSLARISDPENEGDRKLLLLQEDRLLCR